METGTTPVRFCRTGDVPLAVMPQCFQECGIERDRAALARFGLALADGEELLVQVQT